MQIVHSAAQKLTQNAAFLSFMSSSCDVLKMVLGEGVGGEFLGAPIID